MIRKWFGQFKLALLLLIAMTLIVSIPVYAAWEFRFPTIVADNSSTTRSYYPVVMGWNGQTFVDAGKISSSGNNSDMQIGTTSIKYMISTANVVAVIPSLPANGQQILDFYTGYSPEQSSFAIATGDGGSVNTTDNAALEPSSNFSIQFTDAYLDTTAGAGKYLFNKPSALSAYVSTGTSGNVVVERNGAVAFQASGITSGEYDVTTEGNYRYPVMATGSVLSFVGTGYAVNSTANWRSVDVRGSWVFWFKTTDAGFGALIGSSDEATTNHYLSIRVSAAGGNLEFLTIEAGTVNGVKGDTVINDGNWHMGVVVSDGSTWTMYVDGVLQTLTVTYGANNGNWNSDVTLRDNLSFMALIRTTTAYTVGSMGFARYYTSALTGPQVTAMYGGDYSYVTAMQGEWYFDEGSGATVSDYSGNGYSLAITNGTWETSTYTAGNTGRLSDFYLTIGSNRWGSNLHGAITNNANNWTLMSGNATRYVGSYREYVGGTEVLRYAPATMLTGANLPDLVGSYNGTITWGTNSAIILNYGEMESYASTAASVNLTGGFDMPTSPLPSTWFASGENLASLPFYDSFLDVSLQTGQPLQTIYLLAIIGFAFGIFLLMVSFTRSALLGVIGFNIVLFVGSSMSVVPMWIPFVCLVVQFGIMYTYRQVAY